MTAPLTFPVTMATAARLPEARREAAQIRAFRNIVNVCPESLHGERGRTCELLASLVNAKQLSMRAASTAIAAHCVEYWDLTDPAELTFAVDLLRIARERLAQAAA